MKQTPQMQKIQEAMKPGVITLDGFLGTDERNLVDILTEDDAQVKRLGLTHQQIAKRMVWFREQGRKGLDEFISVEPCFQVRVMSVRGKLPSPFGGPGLYQKRNITVRNLELDREITFTDLHIHMVRDHGFYEGKGSQFRLEPKDLAEILDIGPLPEEFPENVPRS